MSSKIADIVYSHPSQQLPLNEPQPHHKMTCPAFYDRTIKKTGIMAD
jgi:hypothetical protein